MRRTIIFLTLLAALVVPAAQAETGRPPTGSEPGTREARGAKPTARTCRPGAVLVSGALVSASEDRFSMLVKRANWKGRTHVGKTVEVLVLPRTHLRGLGGKKLAEMAAGTRLTADLRVCKARGAEGEATRPELVAAKVLFKQPPQPETTAGA